MRKLQIVQAKRKKPADSNSRTERLLENNKMLYFCALLYLLSIVAYSIIASEFSYAETNFSFKFNLVRFLFSTGLLFVVLMMMKRIKDQFLLFLYVVVTVLLFLGEAICFAFCPNNNPTILIGTFLLLLFLVLTQNAKFSFRNGKISKDPMPILLLLSIILFIPFLFLYANRININNLFLADIYETRSAFREESNQFLGYITAPLSRVILPALIALSLKNKKYNYLIICSIMILFIFLCGALKSILFGLVAVLFFYKGNYIEKAQRLLRWLIIILLIGIAIYYLAGNISILNIVRRVFFVPSRLNSMYVDYFATRPTFLTHSSLGFNLASGTYGSSLSRFFGENVLHSPGLNANVGLIVEGYISFNILGMIAFAFLSAMILNYFKWINLSPIFAGIILVYVYYMNTSFLSTLLLTHGLAFLMVFSYFFMRKSDKVEHE